LLHMACHTGRDMKSKQIPLILSVATCCLVATFLMLAFQWSMNHWAHLNHPSLSSYQPKFHANQCFNRAGIREPWDSNGPDGIIIMKGYASYLVMFRSEAERRSAGEKVGLPFSFESFDETHYEVKCPDEWINHTRRKS
jgi:hypothetical protein